VPRVLTARFMHETNAFRVKTDMVLIRRRDFHLENEIPRAFRSTRSALGATFEAAGKYGWTVHPVSANRTRLASSLSGESTNFRFPVTSAKVGPRYTTATTSPFTAHFPAP
jgi:Metallopeptidase family M81